jgi:hypothetical protein
MPILQHASVEDDHEMQSRWAALLANNSATPDKVLPGFPRILSELSPLDVRILDWLYNDTQPRPPVGENIEAALNNFRFRDLTFHLPSPTWSVLAWLTDFWIRRGLVGRSWQRVGLPVNLNDRAASTCSCRSSVVPRRG